MMTNLNETIARAIQIKEQNNINFVTIWKTGKLFGFNFDNKPIGFTTKEYGIKRTVIGIY